MSLVLLVSVLAAAESSSKPSAACNHTSHLRQLNRRRAIRGGRRRRRHRYPSPRGSDLRGIGLLQRPPFSHRAANQACGRARRGSDLSSITSCIRHLVSMSAGLPCRNFDVVEGGQHAVPSRARSELFPVGIRGDAVAVTWVNRVRFRRRGW